MSPKARAEAKDELMRCAAIADQAVASAKIEPAFYYVSGVVVTTESPAYFQIMEERDGKQTCIAMVPFNKSINPAQGREPARRDADLIVRALNALCTTPVASDETSVSETAA